MKKVRFTIDERKFRNNRGELRIGYVTRLLPGDRIDRDKFIDQMCKATGMTGPRVEFVLSQASEIMTKHLLNGSLVDMPHIGTFRLGLSSTATVRKQDAGVKAMKYMKVNYNPALKIKKLTDLGNMAFQQC